jgi:hypothetical protein
MTAWRLATLNVIAAIACAFAGPAWANGDGFFESKEIPGKPEFVIFGNVKDDRGKYLDNATVRVQVAEHMLEFTTETDVIGRFRTPDVGRAIKDLGYEVDLSLIAITVEYPDHHVERREYRGKRGQKKGAIEINFRMKKGAKQGSGGV